MSSQTIPQAQGQEASKPVTQVDLLSPSQPAEKQRQEWQEELDTLKERFNYVQKATQDAVWDWDLAKNTAWYSDGLNILFGHDPRSLSDGVKFWHDTIHPDDRERVINGIHSVIDNGGKNWQERYRFKRADGSYAWVLDRGYAIHDSSGTPVRMVGSMQDITEQREVLQTLKESEERLRMVIDAAKIGIWDFDPRTGKLIWDVQCRALFGMAADDPADYDVFLERIHPDDRKATDEANRYAISGVGSSEYDIEYRTVGLHDQKIRWIRAKGRGYKDENGVTVRYAGTVMDITQEKKQEQHLREQEERFRLLATSIPQIVWTTDEHGIVDYMSDKWLLYTGHTPTYEKFSFRELMHPNDLQNVVPNWNECIRQKVPYHGEYRLRNITTNEYRWFSCTTAPLKDHDGKVIKWIGSATDIHDQKMTEMRLENRVAERTKELNELNQQLEKSNSELEQYAYVTSHDLKEPLRKIQTYHNLIATKYLPQLPPEVAEYLSKIASASSRMSGLIDDLLKYSRLSNPETSLDLVDLNKVVGQISTEFEYHLKQKVISVHVGQLPVLKAVSVHMQQLFSNLFSNSIKFSKPDTPNKITITCTLLSEEEKAKYAELKAPGRHFKITFQDEGIGFSSKYSEQVFTIFQRLNNRNAFEGHGIGLALCRKIVGNHHGIILANGKENNGAWFTIILPEGLKT